MPTMRFTGDDQSPARLIDCLGIPTRPSTARDPFLEFSASGIGAISSGECVDETTSVRYTRRFAGGLWAETRFEQTAPSVWERHDRLRNDSAEPITLTTLACRFDLDRGAYELYSQAGGWCTESQGRWEPFTHGSRVLASEWGRTAQGATPFLAVRLADNTNAVAFHLLPRGNWRIEARPTRDAGRRFPTLSILLGPDEPNGLELILQPGSEYTLPSLLLIGFPADHIELAAPPLHAAMADKALPLPKPPPMVYNTWFESFANLETERLHQQVAAAAEVGCEVFVVDAGWYGSGEGWACQGDWSEKTDRAFHGKMKDFADHVRAAGLGFGLWMEPEAIHPSTPMGQNPPEWLRRGPTGMFWPDLTQQAGYDWVRGEMARLLDTYGVVWMKIDFNQAIGPDPAHGGMRGYYDAWYRLLAELRDQFPDTVFENCGSGAMRLDMESYQHFHGHFLSDTVHPVDTLRIMQGTLLRLPPGALYTWTVFAPAGPMPFYPHAAATAPPQVLTPCDATWHRAETVDIGFAMAAAMPGMLGLSGDLAGLAPENRAEIARWASLWKENRHWLRHCHAHLLTPVRPLQDNTGWVAFEFADADHALVLAFRLNDFGDSYRLVPRSLDPAADYQIRRFGGRDPETRTGRELLGNGLACRAGRPFLVDGAILSRET
jgi:alpha-galactosidase